MPQPGGPKASRLWPPAAAIWQARKRVFCPYISSKEEPAWAFMNKTPSTFSAPSGMSPSLASLANEKRLSSKSAEKASRKLSAPKTFMPGASAASSAFARGTTQRFIPFAAAVQAAALTALTGLMAPESSSSPMTRTLSSGSARPPDFWPSPSGPCPAAPSTPKATGKSKPAPSFFKSAGERLIKTRSQGNSKPEFLMALFMRSRLSLTAPSAKPTMSIAGIPRLMSTSTETKFPS